MKPYFLAPLLIAFTGFQSFAQTPAPQEQTEENQSPEQPPWQVCNETSFILNIATAAVPEKDAGTTLTVTGWQKIRPGACQIMTAKKGTPRYVYARSDSVHQGGIREWKGQHEFCVGGDDFTAKTDISCALQNLKPARFLRVIPTEERTAFTEPAGFGKKAETAGLQRLLLDNNYDIKRVDGMGGRRTSNTLNKFLKDSKLERSISTEDKFTALETSALELQSSVGITLCNDAGARLWSAVAYHTDAGFESRGWWPIEAGECARPFTSNLIKRDAHFYARLETMNADDKILKVSKKDAKEFCVGESKFSAVRHEFCEDQGYIAARFKALPNDKIGAKISLKIEDFTAASLSGLRQ